LSNIVLFLKQFNESIKDRYATHTWDSGERL
jgi:hypothetical protein